jgi:D-glycero-D-manno-heptose 1,7-bisphosphate phosphatase
MSNKQICVFLDRDGVINSISNGYANTPDTFEFVAKSPQAIKMLNEHNIKVVVVTNQGGIESGHLTHDDLTKVHKFMEEQLKKFGAKVDKIYYCSTNDQTDSMRKPNPGMLLKAIEDLKLNPKGNFYLIGDSLTDIQAGNAINATTILVKTGLGTNEYNKIKSLSESPSYVSQNLYTSVLYVLKREKL